MKTLDISQVLKTFEGKPVKDGEDNMVVKTVLLAYLSSGQSMDLKGDELGHAYSAGMKIGPAKGTVELDQKEYDVVKKLADNGKLKRGQEESPIFNLVIQQQVKQMIDAAEEVKKKDEKGGDK